MGSLNSLESQELKFDRRNESRKNDLGGYSNKTMRIIRPNAGNQVNAWSGSLIFDLRDRQRQSQFFSAIVEWDGNMNHGNTVAGILVINAPNAHDIGIEEIHPDSQDPFRQTFLSFIVRWRPA